MYFVYVIALRGKTDMSFVVDLSDYDQDLINAVAKAQSISSAEFIRRAIGQILAARRQTQIKRVREAAFGLPARRSVDGLEYQDRIRQGWE
jgi:hypothetical protein